MPADFLPQFRRRLYEWLQYRLDGGRTPFRRAEECPQVMTCAGPANPDLVLWINRDSLLAGAMILIPHRSNATLLEAARKTAGSLGLRQFVTWDARSVTLWNATGGTVQLLQSWAVPAATLVSADDFTVTFDALLQELKGQAVAALLPAEELPPAYFANLCRQVLCDIAPALLEAARLAARSGQTDADTLRRARDKGWLILWQLLALLWHERMPAGIRPERLERALGYALADLPPALLPILASQAGDPPLPETAAIRLHHLAGRLAQLGWQRNAHRAHSVLNLLLAESCRLCNVETAALSPATGPPDLLVNHIPPQPLAAAALLAPRPCLAGLALSSVTAGQALPALLGEGPVELPGGLKPRHIAATLVDVQPPTPAGRRQRLAALRQPWPYRRFRLAASTPAWLWDALHLGGLVATDGTLLLTLPAHWADAPEAELLWRTLAERLTLTGLRRHADGRQTLVLIGHPQAPAPLQVCQADGSCRELPPLSGDMGVSAIAALVETRVEPPRTPGRQPRPRPDLAESIAAKVFRDGLPNFPGHYLRRFDLPPLRSYRLPGPLHIDSHFFERVSLRAADGSLVEADHPAAAEALLLASRDGRPSVDLPADPALTARLVSAYRSDLQHLWEQLLDECRRHHPAQGKALALARRLWQERNLPPCDRG
jgi:hypothetical protein